MNVLHSGAVFQVQQAVVRLVPVLVIDLLRGRTDKRLHHQPVNEISDDLAVSPNADLLVALGVFDELSDATRPSNPSKI